MLVTNFWQVIIQVFSKSDYRFYKKAKQVAKISDFKKVHIGCIAVYQGKIIGIGCNTNKTHPLQKYYNKYREEDINNTFVPKLHAEINCLNSIRHLDINFHKVKLYIFRDCKYNASGIGISRPCPSCMAAITDLGIQHIYYTTDDGYAYERIRPKGCVA